LNYNSIDIKVKPAIIYTAEFLDLLVGLISAIYAAASTLEKGGHSVLSIDTSSQNL